MKVFIKITACLLALCCVAFVFSACAGKDITVTINDSGTKTDVEVKTGITVSEAIDKAGIELGEKDETEPPKDETINEDTTEITIKRYAKVTVVKGKDKKEVELVGGTVEEAVKKAGFTLAETDKLSADKNAYLKDGMTITITEAIKVTIAVDGKTNTVSTNATDVKGLIEEQKIKIGKDDVMSEKLDAPLKNGMKITIKRVTFKDEKKTESIDYETEKKYSDSMDEGSSQVEQKGEKGEKEVVYTVKYVDGKEVSREKKSEKITKQPVKEIITYGTKEVAAQEDNDSDNNTGSNNNNTNNNSGSSSSASQESKSSESSGGGKTVVSKTPVYDCDGSGHGYYKIVYSDGSKGIEEF